MCVLTATLYGKGKKSRDSPSQLSPQAAQEQGTGWGIAHALAPAPEQRPWVTVAPVPEWLRCDGAGGQLELTGMQLGCTHWLQSSAAALVRDASSAWVTQGRQEQR